MKLESIKKFYADDYGYNTTTSLKNPTPPSRRKGESTSRNKKTEEMFKSRQNGMVSNANTPVSQGEKAF